MEIPPLKIGGLVIWPPVISAPMAGYTNELYREILREHGCPCCYTEMVSAKGLILGGDDSFDILEHSSGDRPLVLQLFGYDPDDIGRAIEKVQRDGPRFDAIDINMGCPARKITSQGSGGALLKDLDKVCDIVAAAKSASCLPVTVKTRLGWDDPSHAAKIAARLEAAGADMITIHGRTVLMGYSGRADWKAIDEAASHVAIPVVGNGDVSSPEDALEKLRTTAVSGIMVGRCLLGNPAFFDSLAAILRGDEPFSLSTEKKMALAEDHFSRSIERYGPVKGLLDMRKHLPFYFRGVPGASRLREAIVHEKSPEKVLHLLKEGWRTI